MPDTLPDNLSPTALRVDPRKSECKAYVNYHVVIVLLSLGAWRVDRPNVWVIDAGILGVQCPRMAGVAAAERIYKQFGMQMRDRREVLGLTQLQLSKLIGLTRGSIANIEAGRQSVLLHQFLAIAAALQLAPEQLLPAKTDIQPASEPAMPEAVVSAIQSIRTSTGARSQSRR